MNYFKYLQFSYWDQLIGTLKVENKQIYEVTNLKSLRAVMCLGISLWEALWGALGQMPLRTGCPTPDKFHVHGEGIKKIAWWWWCRSKSVQR